MLGKDDISIINTIFTDGKVLEEHKFITDDNVNVECYLVEYYNEEYTLTSHNGTWVYIHHKIK